ncbi:uncharacterized protein EV154DRAFT_147300 [Mucor mucedo]|uniref:uncharacterized protein n=1 Tax=Mucor mucedo TaxID=29922 RepID=UPI0022207BF6|nr:uncharacterized protein EV154DRAFT_147300 [Mucor mucedo]KAI7867322.1 hypothetical protein EV154DRAFT_147300 [Mucor mucedo]
MAIFGLSKSHHRSAETTPSVSDVDKLSIKDPEPGYGGQFKEFLKTVISFTGDLSSLTCPAFFLNGLSLLEYGTYWGDHPTCFNAVTDSDDPEERMLAVARWFMSTLWGSYASRCTNGLTEKKPYNPILGEQFHCHMGNIKCICEQVCHHPPISAFYLENEVEGVSLNGHCGQKSKFKGTTIKVEQVGRAVLNLKKFDEQYVIDYPDLLIRGVLTGSCYLELSGVCTIASSSGAKTVIEFIPKPWFGGEYHRIKGHITYNNKPYCDLSGRWSSQSFFTKTGSSTKELLFDAEDEPMAERKTPPLEEQTEIESHRLWRPVTEALKEKNYSVANEEKSKIENWQRKIRKDREAHRTEDFHPKLFTFSRDVDASDHYSKRTVSLLGEMVGKPFLDEGAWTYNNSLHKH